MFRKQESMTIKEFMDRKPKIKRISKNVYKIVLITGLTAIVFLSGFDIVSAAGQTSSIDAAAAKIYEKLLVVGKWIIIIKGGIDTINNVVQGDVSGAKKNFLGYLIVYLILNGLPWAMDEVDKVFNQI